VQISSYNSRFEGAYGFNAQRLKLEYDKTHSIVAFKINLRRYSEEATAALVNVKRRRSGSGGGRPDGSQPNPSLGTTTAATHFGAKTISVGRCSLTLSNLMLRPPMASALESRISYPAFIVSFQFQLAPLYLGPPADDEQALRHRQA
jgi:hypothetical protein